MKLRIRLEGILGEAKVNWFNGWNVGKVADMLAKHHSLQKDGFAAYLYRENGDVLQRTMPLNQMGHPEEALLELRMVPTRTGIGDGK